MNINNINKFEEAFVRNLDEKFLSYDIIRPNRFTDIVCVTAIKTGRKVSVYFDSLDKEINFCNDSDENFVRPLSLEGAEKLFEDFNREVSQSFDIIFWCGGESVGEFRGKIENFSNQVLKNELNELKKYVKGRFDSVSVSDFCGKVRKVVKYDDGLSNFIFGE